ncbi:MAG: tetratricopeptide repeat protein [Pseudomonadota bacterium]
MLKSDTRWIGAAICALAITSCVSGNDGQTEAEAEMAPFIDPVVLSQNQCGGASKPSLDAQRLAGLADMADFNFGSPFVLAGDVVAHFRFPITTDSDAAQIWFDTGLAHMANFNHDEAIAAFRKARQYDPDCGMCHWAEALAFGSNINAPFDPKRGAAGLVAAHAASQRLGGASDRERALIEAVAVRYAIADDGSVVEKAEAYADAMDAVARAFPDDKLILSLAAEANMDTQPWDYWEPGARVPKGRSARTIELLEAALGIDPDFAPAIHLYIHATEASVDPFRAEAYADRLAGQSLGVGHLIHMPSHIYLKLGHWKKAHDTNIEAIAADEHYLANSTNSAFYGQVYYPHNVHFVVSNAQLGGDGNTARIMADKLSQTVTLDPAAPDPFGEHIVNAPLFTALQFGDDQAVLATPEPPAAHLFNRATWHYARGTVFARQGDLGRAETERAAIEAILNAPGPGLAVYDAVGMPLLGTLSVASLTLESRIHAAEGHMRTAIERLGAASDVHEQLAYMEPTWWYYPTRQTLAALLLQDGQLDRAEREFFKTLIKSPNNAYALHGLAETYKAQGNLRSETYARQLFEEAWIGPVGETPSLSDL